MRAFVSIQLSPIVQKAIEEAQARLRPEASGARWLPVQNCHLTLAFLGDMDEQAETRAVGALSNIGADFDPFEIALQGAGQFPPRGPFAVLWLGVGRGEAALKALAAEVRERLKGAEVGFDKKPFAPHITIARAQRGRKAFFQSPGRFAELEAGSQRVEAVSLMQSVLDPKGAVYTERKRFLLESEPVNP